MAREWEVTLYKDLGGEVSVRLVEVDELGVRSWIDDARFGPFDTALDVCNWLTRHWAPRARLPLR